MQASEALADLLCHPSGVDRGNSAYNNNASATGRLQAGMGRGIGMGYLGGSGGVAAAAAARESDLRSRLMFFFDM